jgi:hypothetical protein
MKSFGGGLSTTRNIISSDVVSKISLTSNQAGLINKNETIEYNKDVGMSNMYKDSKYFTPLSSSVPQYAIHNAAEYKKEDASIPTNKVLSEDPLRMGDSEITQANLYNSPMGVAQSTYESFEKNGETQMKYTEIQAVVNSLFNPYYGVHPRGVGPGQWPVAKNNWDEADNISGFKYNYLGDCRISTLVNLSKYSRSILGQARYKYSDFMFCKELGMPNNHLITLRRYASPIGDQIHGQGAVANNYAIITMSNVKNQKDAKKQKSKKVKNFENSAKVSDVGHMCCYFGGEDNKLEDIIKYSFKQTYKTMNSEIQRQDSKEDDRPSLLGAIVNTASAGYRAHMANSTAGNNNLLAMWGSHSRFGIVRSIFGSQPWHHNDGALYHVDKNKIYEPKNTIQEVDYYEGKIQFQHEFSLVFSYEMRAYDNISPKAAMLDLIANILRTCGTHGSFWGGARQLNGPSPNSAGWNKANHLIDNTWDALGSGIGTMFQGGFSMDSIMSGLSKIMSSDLGQMVQGLVKKATDTATALANGIKGLANGTATREEVFTAIWDGIKKFDKATGLSDMAKAKLKDAMGRPQVYAWDSLLSGGDTGMWHVTIGNPLRPIMTFGNLEVTNTTVEHSGPLGIDDFPTKLKVTVQLKHARPRDIGAIEKMYAFGASSIYKGKSKSNPSRVYKIFEKDATSSNNRQQVMSSSSWVEGADPVIEYQTVPATEAPADSSDSSKTDASTETAKADAKNDKNAKDAKNAKKTAAPTEPVIAEGTNWDTYTVETTAPFSQSGFGEFIPGLEYVGEFDWQRIRANMDELYQ